MSEADRGISLSSRSVQSDVCHPNDQNDKNKRGSYVVNADPEYENAKTPDRQMSQMSGDYDYPDPYPQNQRESYYDNPGLQKVFIQKNDSFLKILSKIYEKKKQRNPDNCNHEGGVTSISSITTALTVTTIVTVTSAIDNHHYYSFQIFP